MKIRETAIHSSRLLLTRSLVDVDDNSTSDLSILHLLVDLGQVGKFFGSVLSLDLSTSGDVKS